jgi:toxin ParE1/3/4
MRIDGSPHALEDLKSIAESIEQDRSLETSNRIMRVIYTAVQSLRNMPLRGRQGRLEQTRELVLSNLPYLVVYQVSDERMLILTIVHGAQKWP